MRFSDEFRFGVSTASFQIEGSPLADGAVPSNWYRFTHRRGRIAGGDNADVACDHYYRFEEDFTLLEDLGIKHYRFSMAWPRIVPAPGIVNEAGLAFYDRILDSLLRHGIEPLVTMLHFDVPEWLESAGGFTNEESVRHFAFYARTLLDRFGDRVRRWITINEPMVFTAKGYLTGISPPGRKYDLKGFCRASHHLLKAHAETVTLAHSVFPEVEIGIAEAQLHIKPWRPNLRRDVEAAITMDALLNRMFIDPITKGSYPEQITAKAAGKLPVGWERDLESMNPPVDFIGLNYYTGPKCKFALLRPLFHVREVKDPAAPRSPMWEIAPEGIYELLLRLRDEYGNPRIMITENGYPLPEPESPIIDDEERIVYLYDHLKYIARAIDEGVRCEGYYHWSFTDNFEWDLGYYMRFGLVRVDFGTQERTPRRSAFWYRDLAISRNLVEPGGPATVP